jgi:GNAT superfamily N-acetyltransferase
MSAQGDPTIDQVGEKDLPDLLPLMRAYCDFYEATPAEADLLAVSRALIRDPEREGLQLIARDGDGRPLAFTTLYWSWSTLSTCRKGILNDLFVVPEARGSGLAEALIEASRARCREHGAATMSWQTAKDNRRAHRLYERVGAQREEWLDFSLSTDQSQTPS